MLTMWLPGGLWLMQDRLWPWKGRGYSLPAFELAFDRHILGRNDEDDAADCA